MGAPDITISLERDVTASSPEAEPVIAGLMAYNTAHLPPSHNRFMLVIGDPETGAPAAGMTLIGWGDTAYCFWGVWSVPDAVDHPGAVAVLLALAEQELARRNMTRMEFYIRAHDDTAPYRAHGFSVRQQVEGHVNGRPFTVMEKPVAPSDNPPGTDGLSIALHAPPSRLLGRDAWGVTDRRRRLLLAQPLTLVAAMVRDRTSHAVLGGALCYASQGDFMVDMVWLDEKLRGTGVGFDMLARALDEGRALGCTRAGVETMDCQAPKFYPKHGFQRFAHVASAVPGMGMNFYEMRL